MASSHSSPLNVNIVDINTRSAAFTQTLSARFIPLATFNVTPRSASSKFLIMATLNVGTSSEIVLLKNGTSIQTTASIGSRTQVYTGVSSKQTAIHYVDAPGSTSAITYQIAYYCPTGSTVINKGSIAQSIIIEI